MLSCRCWQHPPRDCQRRCWYSSICRSPYIIFASYQYLGAAEILL